MKKLLFLSLVILAAACVSNDPEPAGPPPPLVSDNPIIKTPDSPNAIDPGCHGGEWFEVHNLGTITPWTYGEWASFVIKANVPQTGNGGMGPVQIKYKFKNTNGRTVRMNFMAQSGSGTGGQWTGNFLANLAANQSVTMTLTINTCQPVLFGGWFEYPFAVKFDLSGGGSGTNTQMTGEILSVTALDCVNYPWDCTEHKVANHDQGFSWTIVL